MVGAPNFLFFPPASEGLMIWRWNIGTRNKFNSRLMDANPRRNINYQKDLFISFRHNHDDCHNFHLTSLQYKIMVLLHKLVFKTWKHNNSNMKCTWEKWIRKRRDWKQALQPNTFFFIFRHRFTCWNRHGEIHWVPRRTRAQHAVVCAVPLAFWCQPTWFGHERDRSDWTCVFVDDDSWHPAFRPGGKDIFSETSVKIM